MQELKLKEEGTIISTVFTDQDTEVQGPTLAE